MRKLHFTCTLVTLGLLILCTGCRQDRVAWRANRQLDPVLHQMDVVQATLSARVIDLKDGSQIYAFDPDREVIPASNLKLVTSASGLDTFSPTYRFQTYLAADGDNLWIIGSGDPATGDAKIAGKYGKTTMTILQDWTRALKAKGINHVSGNIYYYDGAFELTQVNPYWSRGYLQEWYAAPVSGLNFNDNCIDVTVEPAADGKPAKFTVVPPVSHIKIDNNSISGGEQNNPNIVRGENDVFTITGHVTKKTKLKSRAVTDPGFLFADALSTEMKRQGITFDGRILRAPAPLGGMEVPSSAKVIAVHETLFSDILWRILENSQNLFAECLFKATGKKVFDLKGDRGPGSWQKGIDAAHIFLRSWKINDKQLVMVDGSGLARANRVTARLITDLLVAMHRHPYGTLYRESLAKPGANGTMGKRLTELEGRVWAKTGYIGGVRSLSGYVHTKQDHWLAFSFIYNDIPGEVKPFETMQDQAVRILYEKW